MQRSLSIIVLACLAAGCTLGPDYKRPEVDLPSSWQSRAAAPAPAAAPASAPVPGGGIELLDTAWWSAFGDPALDELIRSAVDQNKDLRIAALRVEQFDAYLQVSKAAGGPQAGVQASRTRDILSENRQVTLSPGTEPVGNSYIIGVAAGWELDLWGKVARSNESAYADLVAREENRRALVLSLVSEVATGYIRLLVLDRELELLKQTIASQAETLRLAKSRFDNGGSSESPVVRAQAELQQWQAELPAKELEVSTLELKLCELAGRNPGPIARGKPIGELALPKVPAGLPSDLLLQRPDIRQAEQELVAANAKIGVAKAQYLPTIALTGSTGQASDQLSTLTLLTSNFGSYGITLLGPIFTSGRIAGQVREAEAVQKQVATAYLRTVQTALREVEAALNAHDQYSRQLALRELQVQTQRTQLQLAERRYEGGGSGYFEVLEADRALKAGLQLQNQTRREQFSSLIAVYKSMGGGWSLPDVVASRSTPPKPAP